MNLRRYSGYKILLAATLLIPLGLIGFKIFVLNFPMGDLVPVISYRVDVSMQVDGHGEDINVQTYLPKSDFHQEIGDEQNSSGPFILGLHSQTENRIANWQGLGVSGRQNIVYTFSVKSQPVQYNIPEGLKIPTSYPRLLQGNLQATPGIQVEDPLINETLARLFPVFEKVGISQNLLKIILMIPFGALVTAIFRNVIGLQTFGTFLPVLIATAMRETGLAWGIFAFFNNNSALSFGSKIIRPAPVAPHA